MRLIADQVENLEGQSGTSRNELFVFGHTYQPPREFARVSEVNKGANVPRADMVSGINETIYQSCYRPLFCEGDRLPDGALFSFFGSLREWIMENHPEDFLQIRANILRTPDPEYHVVADPWLHPIMPLQSEANQDMLIKLGIQAFEQDLGFRPKGFWLPEAGVSSATLRALKQNGIEFVVLRSDQLESSHHNPMYVVFEYLDERGQRQYDEIAVFHFNKELSGAVSFVDGYTNNADDFLSGFERNQGQIVSIGSDTELYGWHKKFRDQFLSTVLSPAKLHQHGFNAFNVKRHLKDDEHQYTKLREYSSWSCEHNLHRWTGECSCEGRSPDVAHDIRTLFESLVDTGNRLDSRLDTIRPAWREDFVPFLLAVRKEMYTSGSLLAAMDRVTPGRYGPPDRRERIIVPGRNGDRKIEGFTSPQLRTLFLAQIARFTGATSCYGFYNDKTAPERVLVSINMEEVRKMCPELFR